ncbi:DODA-type extradiol aromatic ring-opening family dioxygenase [Aestuariirhabdus sp. LZHN29]|uniref:DODA-type extradiol aromatic ring-opening family dioxygenase n=1 Tax=Aestuariirhabdus sp. LZHN29 TaxID=3417462 RepID=UPI003CE78779
MPLLADQGHGELVACLEQIASSTERPSAILVISAHWEEPTATLTQGANPPLIYDYYGFPKQAYSVQYPAPGNPALADRICSLLSAQGVEARLDDQRGFDHGVFVPLKIMYPDGDVPCVQLSLLNSLDPAQHIALGRALSALEHEGLWIIGSGMSFHNMGALFNGPSAGDQGMNESFEQWLVDTCANTGMDENEREQRLHNWSRAPAARYCHPREEHLLPLHVCYGVAGRACQQVFELEVMGAKVSMYLW